MKISHTWQGARTSTRRRGWMMATALVGALALSGAGTGMVQAQTAPFTELGSFSGRIMASGPERAPIVPGGSATISARGLLPGQKVMLRQSGTALNGGQPYVADDKGNFSATVQVPEGAATGTYPVVAEFQDPPAVGVFDVKVSPDLGDIGVENYDLTANHLASGLYQVAEAPEMGALFVTSAVGRPPVTESALMKVDPETLEVLASVTPQDAPDVGDRDGGVFAVYGVGVDEGRGQVWVTNTRQNTVAVYSTDDLSLIKQFPVNTVAHPRDVVLLNGKAYVSSTFTPEIFVFDADALEQTGVIELQSGKRRATFGTASMSPDADDNKLVVASLSSDEVAVVDTTSDEQVAVYAVPGSSNTIGVAYDPVRKQIYTAGQGSDNLSILDGESGALLKSVPVGANPLNIAVDPESGLVYTAVRGSGTLVVTDPEGEVVANLTIGSFPNHLVADGKGGVYVVNKSMGAEDTTGDRITHVVPAQ